MCSGPPSKDAPGASLVVSRVMQSRTSLCRNGGLFVVGGLFVPARNTSFRHRPLFLLLDTVRLGRRQANERRTRARPLRPSCESLSSSSSSISFAVPPPLSAVFSPSVTPVYLRLTGMPRKGRGHEGWIGAKCLLYPVTSDTTTPTPIFLDNDQLRRRRMIAIYSTVYTSR